MDWQELNDRFDYQSSGIQSTIASWGIILVCVFLLIVTH